MEEDKKYFTPTEIAVYAVNCSNDDEYVDEVAGLIENLISRAFVAGRSATSWEQFRKDNGL
jgi:hypothetical protein